MSKKDDLPRWDLSPILPALGEPGFSEAFERARTAVVAVAELFDRHAIGSGAGDGTGLPDRLRRTPATDQAGVSFDEILGAFLDARTRIYLVEAYLECLTAADSLDDPAQARLSELQPSLASIGLLQTRLTAWCGGQDLDQLMAGSDLARSHRFFLERSRVRARHLMTPPEEALASELTITGSIAWERLHGNLTSQILVSMEQDGEARQLPLSAVRNLAHDPDATVRQRAFRAELEAWARVRLPLAAAMNSIKGEVLGLTRRRGWSTPLEATLFDHAIDREILEAMLAAVEESFSDFRRYFDAKARRLGRERLAWFDLYAPIVETGVVWDYRRASEFIRLHFDRFSPRLSEIGRRAFGEAWIDAGPRPGKVGGAFCMWLRGDESRILTNFLPTHQGMSTLAHELGHAYHNHARAGCSILQRRTPSTLAETASIFCETLVNQAAFEEGDERERLAILEGFLQSAGAVLVDVIGRFHFEQAVFDRRRHRDLSADELCEEMRKAQALSYGDGLDPGTYHPYMWAVKPHYYSGSASFYNYPYTFGLLFGLGLYRSYQEHPEGFPSRYEALLSRTGMATADELAGDFGIDLRSGDFWRSSLDFIRERITLFEDLAATEA